MRIDAVILAVLERLLVQQLDRLTLQLIADGCDEDSAAVLDAQREVYAEWRTAPLRDLPYGLAMREIDFLRGERDNQFPPSTTA